MVLVSHSHRFMYIHIPKTGGSSITAALAPFLYKPREVTIRRGWQPKHHYRSTLHHGIRDAVKCGRHPLDEFKKYFILSSVRNPLHRMYSLWNSRRGDMGFEAFCKNPAKGDRYVGVPWCRPQAAWLTKNDNSPLITNFILHFETLEDDFKEFCKLVGIEATLQHLNRSCPPHRNYRDAFTEMALRRTQNFMKPDFDLFGYSEEL